MNYLSIILRLLWLMLVVFEQVQTPDLIASLVRIMPEPQLNLTQLPITPGIKYFVSELIN